MSRKVIQSRGRRFAQGCAYLVVALFIGCYACTKTDAWERSNGSTIGKGTHDLMARGVVVLDWRNMQVQASRVSDWVDSDGYNIEFSGPSDYEFFALSTRSRPAPGVFRVGTGVARDYDAMLILSNAGKVGGREVGFERADSGRVELRSAPSGLDGSYTVYLTGTPPGDDGKHGQVIVSGSFRLR